MYQWANPTATRYAETTRSVLRAKRHRIPGGRASGRSIVSIKHSGPRVAKSTFFGGEKKFLDTERTPVASSTAWATVQPSTGSTNCLSAPAQGVGDEEHLGRTYFIRSIFIKGMIEFPPLEDQANPQADLEYRIALVLSTNTNNGVLNPADVFVTPTGATADVLAFRNLNETSTTFVLKDTLPQRLKVTEASMAQGAVNKFANGNVIGYWEFNHVFKKPIKVRTSATTADITSITDNSLALVGTTSSAVALWSYVSRMRFTEEG